MVASPPVFCFISDGRYKPYKCPHCFKSYSSKSNLNTHVRDLHAAVPQVFTCPYCNKKYSSKNSLRYHITMYHREEKNRDQALQHAIATAQPMPAHGLHGSPNTHDPSRVNQLPTGHQPHQVQHQAQQVQQQTQQMQQQAQQVQQQAQQVQQHLYSQLQQPGGQQLEPQVELSMVEEAKYQVCGATNTVMSETHKC
ncbi:zinc finger protein 384-like [Homarus americanus]|uniref:Zinc finger protein 236-like 1 n=1 Tax=Homarus americanus TaxID=6706 RepID=A0A8J5MZN8_HOMAM|nr:zinc finger protein 384-like [Homarus americanus]XP_042220243.1 zinc finger protein 384-like [Homarus americanus]KAG7170090.1 Zinc finger protein 236-like 1 [Homarus americanus]